jgi:hypothetical protein
VVAMIEEDVKQTRCTTCDAEHPYKGGKAPRRKKKDGTASLYKEVLSGLPESDATPVLTAPPDHVREPEPEPKPDTLLVQDEPSEEPPPPALEVAEPDEDVHEIVPDVEEGPVHRPLIRATLPRPEGQKDTRPLPEFTIRQAGGRGNGHFRGGDARMKARGQGGGNQGPNGNRAHGGPRFAGSRPAGPGRGAAGRAQGGGGFRSPQHPRRGGGGKKRSR